MTKLILVLGDQLSESLPALQSADPKRDQILFAEVSEEAQYVPHHPQKIALVFSAMRHFALALQEAGYQVNYAAYVGRFAAIQSKADTQEHFASLLAAVSYYLRYYRANRLVLTEPGEWRLRAQMLNWPRELTVPVDILEDSSFFANHNQFRAWAGQKKQLRMEYFYRQLRAETGLLMENGQPIGGTWNLDKQNRQAYNPQQPTPARLRHKPDSISREVLSIVKQHFSDHFGRLQPFAWAVTREQALQNLDYFIQYVLPLFGDYQDALANQEDFLFHSLLSPYLNIHLLLPEEVCSAAEQAYYEGLAPLNAVEGFIRQILGWREFVRGVYWLKMPRYAELNELGHQADLPVFYWTAETQMHCVKRSIENTQQHAYAHHIQRLMITGNLALLLGVEPQQVCDWYLAVYIDAYEWVELPNTLGMALYADGGWLASKPYAASGKYIHKMSNYCQHCAYNVKTAEESDSCPFNSLYWNFIHRHQKAFVKNPRMAMPCRTWEKMDATKRRRILARAKQLLQTIDEV